MKSQQCAVLDSYIVVRCTHATAFESKPMKKLRYYNIFVSYAPTFDVPARHNLELKLGCYAKTTFPPSPNVRAYVRRSRNNCMRIACRKKTLSLGTYQQCKDA
jgi:hypothetical protein